MITSHCLQGERQAVAALGVQRRDRAPGFSGAPPWDNVNVVPPSPPRRPPFRFQARPSDFVTRSSGNLYSAGCCCCCCCLHWLGAAVGAGVGIHQGFRASGGLERVHPSMKRAVWAGLGAGLLVTGAISAVTELWILLALAPSLILLPAVVFTPLFVHFKGLRLGKRYRHARAALTGGAPPQAQGAFRTAPVLTAPRAIVPELGEYSMLCPTCKHGLDIAEVVVQCPSCELPLDAPVFPVVAQGMRLMWATHVRAFLWSTGLTVGAYFLMYLFLVVVK